MNKTIGEIATSSLHSDFWKSLGLPVSEIGEALKTDLKALLLQQPELAGCLIEAKFGEMFFETAEVLAEDVREIGMCDSVVFDGNKFWLRCFLRDAIKELLIRKAPNLDTHAHVYVTGSGPLSRMCATVAIGLGFKKLNWVSGNEEELRETIKKLQRLFFDLEINFISDTDLTLQPSNGSLLINTVDAVTGSDLLEDLTFLNFLKEASVVVNLPLLNAESALMHEAESLQIIGIDGVEIWGLRDYYFLKSTLAGRFTLEEAEYLKQWREFFKKQDHGPVTNEATES